MRIRHCETPDLVHITKHSHGVEAIPKIGKKRRHTGPIKPIATFIGTLLRLTDCFSPTNRNKSFKFLAGLRNDGLCGESKIGLCWSLPTRSLQDDHLI